MYELMQTLWFGEPGPLTGDLFAEDAVVETPFAPPGHPPRREGRQAILDGLNPQRAAFPIRIDGCRTRAVHDTADPETIIVEYDLTATSTRTGRQATAPFIGVLTVRDGRIAVWREYQHTLAIQQAVAG
jgi:ketosteroid isomerase-like protein